MQIGDKTEKRTEPENGYLFYVQERGEGSKVNVFTYHPYSL